MSIWDRYTKEQQDEYVNFLVAYGSLSCMFRQKNNDSVPYLDSKFQETVYSRVFNSNIVDIGNTPHDALSVFGSERIGVGLKTWMWSKPSFQKVMQIKRFKKYIEDLALTDPYDIAFCISKIKNDRMIQDYNRLGLRKDGNIYHYITRDSNKMTLNECAYPLIELDNIFNCVIDDKKTSLTWQDSNNLYKYTFSDSQIWQKFNSNSSSSSMLKKVDVNIMDDPFHILMKAYNDWNSNNYVVRDVRSDVYSSSIELENGKNEIEEVYLPLYSYRTGDVEARSGLNAWNAAPKVKGSSVLRPVNEVYIPIPRIFHTKYPDFFIKDIFNFEKSRKSFSGPKKDKPEIRFDLILPSGKTIPALVTQDNMKSLQSGTPDGRVGQSALGQWLLVDVLGLNDRTLVTRSWLTTKGTDSVRLWKKDGVENKIYVDFAPVGSFDDFISK